MGHKPNNSKEMNKMEAKITITGTEKALNVWTMATAEVDGRKYRIEMVRFDEPSIYGIRKGRIRYYERRKMAGELTGRKEFLENESTIYCRDGALPRTPGFFQA